VVYNSYLIFDRFLKSIVTPIMAGLLESDTGQRWTFEKFFETVQSLREMIAIKLFNCSTGSNNKMYINKTDRSEHKPLHCQYHINNQNIGS
jgi:hypothetical protein